MLLQLHVKNFALIDEAEVDFTKGLNILTGETGAGKSVLLGSVKLALGGKADKDLIRHGCEYALVELTFCLESEKQCEVLKNMDIFPDEENIIVIQRKILPNRSVCKVCGETVTVAQLKELASVLLDIYGQHDYQTLLHSREQLMLLDCFASEQTIKCKREYLSLFEEYSVLKNELTLPEISEEQRKRELDFALYEAEEIEKAELKIGEEEILEQQLSRMENHEKIVRSLSGTLYHLQESEASCMTNLQRAVKELYGSVSIDENIDNFAKRLDNLDMELSDLVREMYRYHENSTFDEAEYQRSRERMDLLNHLMMKYGRTIEDVINYAGKQRERIDLLQDMESRKRKLEERLKEKELLLNEAADKLTELRKRDASLFEEEIRRALTELNFLQVEFVVSFIKTDSFTKNGNDQIVFMISTNTGEPLKALSAVASGGELSRIMLAIKTISAHRDEISTLIFDEIDSGISGKTAWKVSGMLGKLSNDRQIISITHLPQITAMADTHFNILKQEKADKTITQIIPLDEEGSLKEIARLLGSDTLTQASLENAKELRKQAQKVKNG